MADYSNPKASNAILGDLQEIVALIQSGAKMDPSGNTNIPNGAKRVVAVSGGYQIQSYNGSTWVSIGKLMHDCDTLDGKNTNTGTTANTIPVRDQNGALPGNVTGNAATATKLQTARTIDLGGILSATEQSFDGSKPITIPVNSVNVNNEQDNALVGEVSKLHGGTGRTDGAAADVVVSSAQGTVKASAYGQIGDAKNINGTDLDTLTVSGNYIATSGTVENNFPYDGSIVWRLNVCRQGTSVRQILFTNESMWTRQSTNTGGIWTGWTPVGKRGTTLSIYVSKSGNDLNTGTDNAYPVLTVNRALEIAHGWAPTNPTTMVRLCFGEGDWGTVALHSIPFTVQIFPFSGTSASSYSASLPVFTELQVYNCWVQLYGAHIETLSLRNLGCVRIAAYLRFSSLNNGQSSTIVWDTSAIHHEVVAKDSHDYVFRAYTDAVYLTNSLIYVDIVENLSLTSFLTCDTVANIMLPQSITVADGVTVTGKKYNLTGVPQMIINKDALDNLPGSTDGTLNPGVRLRSAIWGGGEAHTFMAADATWKKDSTSIYARDVAIDGDPNDLASARGTVGDAYSPGGCDFNTLIKSGHYWFTIAQASASTNTPQTGYAGHLVVYSDASRRYVWQLYFVYNTNRIYSRFYNGDQTTWSSWSEVLTKDYPYAIFTGATSSTAGAKGLVPAPSAGSTDRFLSTDGTFKEATYLDNDIPVSSFKDALVYRNQAGSNRVAVIRVSNETVDGRYSISLGCNTLADDPAVGFDVSRDIETGDVFLTANGDLAVKGNLSITGSISGQNVFSTGDFVWSYASSKSGFLLCNGAAISRTTYADLYAIIGTKFGTGNGSTTFNLPDMRGKVAWGANGNLGSVLAAGLPNITGNVSTHTQIFSAVGAFGLGTGGNRADGGYYSDHIRFDFDASRSNSIYGKASTVQPPAIALNCFIKY